jgi:hypothetical protein
MLRPAYFKWASVVAAFVLLVLLVGVAQAAPPPKYDKSSEAKFKGTVEATTTDSDKTVHLSLKTDKGTVDVMVAPAKFLAEMEISFAKGDNLEVLGCQLTIDGVPVLVARELIRNGDTTLVRDDTGKPVWLGWAR